MFDGDGKPINDGAIEIWQAECARASTRIPKTAQKQPIGPGFRGFGRILTDGDGAFRFQHHQAGSVSRARRRAAGAAPGRDRFSCAACCGTSSRACTFPTSRSTQTDPVLKLVPRSPRDAGRAPPPKPSDARVEHRVCRARTRRYSSISDAAAKRHDARSVASARRRGRSRKRSPRSTARVFDYRLDGPAGAPVLVLSNSLGTESGHVGAADRRVDRAISRAALRQPRPRASAVTPGPYTIDRSSRATSSACSTSSTSIARTSAACRWAAWSACGWACTRRERIDQARVVQYGAAASARPRRWNARIDAVSKGGVESHRRRGHGALVHAGVSAARAADAVRECASMLVATTGRRLRRVVRGGARHGPVGRAGAIGPTDAGRLPAPTMRDAAGRWARRMAEVDTRRAARRTRRGAHFQRRGGRPHSPPRVLGVS